MQQEYEDMRNEHKDLVILLNEVRKKFIRAKERYDFHNRSTWDAYVFWSSKYSIVHEEYLNATYYK